MSIMSREVEFEQRYGHDQEVRFRIEARRNKLLGLWAAEKLGIVGEEAASYAQDVIKEAFVVGGKDSVFHKIRRDFDAGKVVQSDHQIHRTMEELLAQAEEQIHAE